MLKKTMTYTNLDGVEVTEDFYFNLTKAELLKMQLSENEGFKEHLEKIVASGKGSDIVGAFEQILRMAYGERTPDGKFRKSTEAFDQFLATEAYSDLFFELVTDAKKSAEFVNAIIPAAMAEEVKQAQGVSTNMAIVDEVALPAMTDGEKDPREMSHEELIEAYRKKLSSN
jgi:hypothetical protein